MEVLSRSEHNKALAALGLVPFNTLFARFVMENKVDGSILVDDTSEPRTFYVAHPYGMTLLLGDSSNESFNQQFRDYALNENQKRSHFEWMQVFPKAWNAVLQNLFQGKIVSAADNNTRLEKGIVELNTRVNFKFNKHKYLELRDDLISPEVKIVRVTSAIFHQMKGSVVPSNFWRNENDFLAAGAGFSLFVKDQLAATAFSSFVHEDQLELGIETVNEFRGQGYAHQVCQVLIDYCLERNLEPIWACRLENTGSYQLALSLGFEPVLELPYYRLSN